MKPPKLHHVLEGEWGGGTLSKGKGGVRKRKRETRNKLIIEIGRRKEREVWQTVVSGNRECCQG